MRNIKTSNPIYTQVKAVFPAAFKIWISIAALYIGVLGLGFANDVSVSFFTRDPMAIAGYPFYTGLLSNIGILLWTSAAAICFLNYAILSKQSVKLPVRSYLLYSGMLTMLLLLDDLLMMHEQVFPVYLKIPEKAYLIGLGICAGSYLFRFRQVILNTEYTVLLAAYCFLGLSVCIDILPHFQGKYTVEDGCKLLGIATWLLYFFRLAGHLLAPSPAQSGKFKKNTPVSIVTIN
jgi:hypothetical protein